MAVIVYVQVSGFTAAQYDAVRSEVHPGGHIPPGNMFHAAGDADGTWSVVDLWESAEAFEGFMQSAIGPAMAKAGVTTQPQIKVWPLHFTAHSH